MFKNIKLMSLFLLLSPFSFQQEIEINKFENTEENINQFQILCANNKSIATSYWEVYYSDKGIHFNIEYQDDDLFYNNIYDIGFDDNFEFLINLKTTETSWIKYKTYHFLMSANGEVYFERAIGPTTIGDRFHKSMGVVLGENLDYSIEYIEEGFKSKVFIAYDLLKTTEDIARGNLSICPAIRNTHIYKKDSQWNFFRENGCNWNNPSTFLEIK